MSIKPDLCGFGEQFGIWDLDLGLGVHQGTGAQKSPPGAGRVLAWRAGRGLKLKCSWRSFTGRRGNARRFCRTDLTGMKASVPAESFARVFGPSGGSGFRVAKGGPSGKTKSMEAAGKSKGVAIAFLLAPLFAFA